MDIATNLMAKGIIDYTRPLTEAGENSWWLGVKHGRAMACTIDHEEITSTDKA